jgi:hypothetical protein
MIPPSIKSLKPWLIALTAWQCVVSIVIVILAFLTLNPSNHDPQAMFTRWYGNGDLNIGVAGTDPFFVTHLKDVNRHSFAELPKPLLVASSGGVLIPQADLAKLTWIVPPDTYESAFPSTTNEIVAAPTVGTPVEAIYLVPASAKFKAK